MERYCLGSARGIALIRHAPGQARSPFYLLPKGATKLCPGVENRPVDGWHVVADTLYNMDTPADFLPDEIESHERQEDKIVLTTNERVISIEMF